MGKKNYGKDCETSIANIQKKNIKFYTKLNKLNRNKKIKL